MAEITLHTHLEAIGRDAWNACFPGELENADYLQALEQSQMARFEWRYIAVYDHGQLVAAMPAFLHDYALDTTLEGNAKKIAGVLRRMFPSLLDLKLACLGSPCTEYGQVGFHPRVADAERTALLHAMTEAFEKHAIELGYRLIGAKDIPEADHAYWAPMLKQRGFRHMPGMPVASLPIQFTSMDEYFAQLSPGTRKDMRRKLRDRANIRIEYRDAIDDCLPAIADLYKQTHDRAEMQLEELPARFFRDVLTLMPDRAFYILYFVGSDLLGANLMLRDSTTLLDKFFCMDHLRGREHNLYFLSWFTNLEYCLSHGLTRYQSGQAGYENKRRLGSQPLRTHMYFKHRNWLIQGALRLAAPLLTPEGMEEAA